MGGFNWLETQKFIKSLLKHSQVLKCEYFNIQIVVTSQIQIRMTYYSPPQDLISHLGKCVVLTKAGTKSLIVLTKNNQLLRK